MFIKWQFFLDFVFNIVDHSWWRDCST